MRLVKISNAGVVLYLGSLEDSAHNNVTVRLDDCSREWAGRWCNQNEDKGRGFGAVMLV